MKFRILALIGLLVVNGNAFAENWAQWRGPFFNGSTTEKNLPETWSKTENVIWSVPMPGLSGATPIVWGDKVFMSTADAQKNLLLMCLDRKDGKVLWQQTVGFGDRPTDQKNNMASASPVTDGKMVWAMFGTGDLAAYDFSGKEIWKRNLGKDFGKLAHMWLYGASPLLYKDRLYISVLQRNPPTYAHALDDKPERESFLLCVDPKTGKDIWRQVRETDALAESMESYATPLPYKGKKREEIIVVGGDYVTGHDPKSGKELWRCGSLNAKKSQWWRIVTSPVAVDGFIFASAPKKEPLLAIKEGGNGDITESHISWRLTENTPDVCTPLVYKGKLFVLDGDKKVMTCLDPKTGKEIWRGDLGVREVFKSSPTGADDKIYCMSERGTVVVLSAGDEFKILSKIEMGDFPNRSSIVAAHGNLFIRTAETLYCIGKK
ncbi:MAG: PQQ-binding-like beta-propeller repeat protein [Verrucomicrobia bacterium]|nr:PQQ-binding-like beta-propeller repeat protein [Verrucomicrobiota bacterium]